MSNLDRSPCIVGLGASAPQGRTWAAVAAAIRVGVTRFAEHPYHVDTEERPVIVSSAPWLDPYRSGSARQAELAAPAIAEAMRAAPPGTLRVWLGLCSRRPGRARELEQRLPMRLRSQLAALGEARIDVIADDHSAGLVGLARAAAALRDGEAELALVVGVDSLLAVRTLTWLEGLGRLHTWRNPWGLVPGEAAGAVLLATRSAAERHGTPILGVLRSVALARGSASDAVETGAALTPAVHEALCGLPAGAKIDQRHCDLNNEPWRADEFAFVTPRISGRLVHPDEFVAPAESWGDVGAATGPLLVALAVAAAQRGHARGEHTLITTSSPGGQRGAAVVSAATMEGISIL